jgi:hypothetical protein
MGRGHEATVEDLTAAGFAPFVGEATPGIGDADL